MSFFRPLSLPLVSDLNTSVGRTLHRARIVGNFAILQALVQLIGFLSGILLIRWLPQREYAYYTIANTMQGALNVLADIGISVGVLSIGGRVWQDRHRLGALINTALGVRRTLAAIAIVIVTPVLYLMLVRNGASSLYSALLIGLVVGGLLIQLSLGILVVVPRLHSNVALIQSVDFTGALVRLLLVVGLLFLFLNAGVAVAVALAISLLQYAILHRYVARVVDLTAPNDPEDRRAIIGFVRKLAVNSVFYCFQGQITVFLISFFANRASSVAEVGALGRLAMIFAVISSVLTNILVPAFARCQDSRKLRFLYLAIFGGVAAFGVLIIAVAWIFPSHFLLVLGPKYQHLHHELLLMVGGAVVSALAATLWSLNAAKAWVDLAWLYVPLTLVTQIAVIPFTDFSSVTSVLLFNLFSVVPSLLLNLVLGFRGFRILNQPAG